MSDPAFREIQLGTKQLVFLFMASVVLAVAIFLLGVSVGRGVRAAAGPNAPVSGALTPAAEPPQDLPPPTVATPADLAYHNQLQAQASAPGTPTPPATTGGAAAQSPPTPSAALPPPPAEPTPAAAPAEKVASVGEQTGARETASPDKTTATAPAPSSGWSVQVGAFSSRDNADKMVSQLKAKGYIAFVYTSGASHLFHVRVGPYPQRADADRAVSRLRGEGYKESAIVH